MEKRNVFYNTENFVVFAPNPPHVTRKDGGHLVIKAKRDVNSRLDLSSKEATEVMRLSMLISEAMINGMRKQGVDIQRINYQENGNWSYLRGEEPFFHIHIYGRTKDSIHQKWGEALYFPDPSTKFNKDYEAITDEDAKAILKEIQLLENNEKYNLENWK